MSNVFGWLLSDFLDNHISLLRHGLITAVIRCMYPWTNIVYIKNVFVTKSHG